jgi:hypothetical protein
MPIRVVEESRFSIRLVAEGRYAVDDVAAELERCAAVEPLIAYLTLDLTQATVNHSMLELERLAALLSVYSGQLRFEVADVLRFGFARAMSPQCEARGARVEIVYRDQSG